jgi:hypothetical protein
LSTRYNNSEAKPMTTPTEKILNTSLSLAREAGTAITTAASNSQIGSKLARNLPKLKDAVSVGAGLALARRGSKAAVGAVRRNPVAAMAGAVALAGVGIAVAVVKRRKDARENGAASTAKKAGAKPTKLAAKSMRGTAKKPAASKTKVARKAPAKRKPKA